MGICSLAYYLYRGGGGLKINRNYYQPFAFYDNYCLYLQSVGNNFDMNRKKSIAKWVLDLQLHFRLTFTLDEIRASFPEMKDASISRSIAREIQKKRIMSPWRGFYVIIPNEYRLKGVVPQNLYIDYLMAYLKKTYYVSLLNAAQRHGASHQVPMAFYVTIEAPSLRDKKNTKYITHFVVRDKIPSEYVERVGVETGWINYSSPELTAVDIITYRHNIGGLDRASTLLAELGEKLNFSKLKNDFSKVAPLASFQRLGYILEIVLGYKEVADDLYNLVIKTHEPKRYVPLKSNATSKGYHINKKWKIIENFEIEIDDV